MTSRVLFDWKKEHALFTTDLCIDRTIFASAVEVFEVIDFSPQRAFLGRLGEIEKEGMRLLSTMESPSHELTFYFASSFPLKSVDRDWRELGTVTNVGQVYKYYLDQLLPPEFSRIRKTLDVVWMESDKEMAVKVVELNVYIAVHQKKARELSKLANSEGWVIRQKRPLDRQEYTLTRLINREYLQAVGEIALLFVAVKKIDGQVLGLGFGRVE